MNIQSALFRDYLNQHRVLQHKSVMNQILQLEESLRQTNELLEFSEHFSRCGTGSSGSHSTQSSDDLSSLESLYFFPQYSQSVQPSIPLDPMYSPLMELERNIQQLTSRLQHGAGYHLTQSSDEDSKLNRMQTDSPIHSPKPTDSPIYSPKGPVEPPRRFTDSPDLMMLGLSDTSEVGGPTNADGHPIPLNDLSTSSIASLASSVTEDSEEPILSAALYPPNPNSPSPSSPSSFRAFFPTPRLATTLRTLPSNCFPEEKDSASLSTPNCEIRIQNPPTPTPATESVSPIITHRDIHKNFSALVEFPMSADSLDSPSSIISEVEVSSPHTNSLTASTSAPLLSEIVNSPSTINSPSMLNSPSTKPMSHSSRSPDCCDEKKKPRFRCQYPGCNKTYTAKFSLKRHEKKHTGEKLFVCNHASHANQNHQPEGGCGKSFPEKWRLKRHQKHLNLGKGTI